MNTISTTEKTTQPAKTENRGYLLPLVDIVETKDAYVLEAEMPGVNKSGLEVLLERNELTIVGRRTNSAPRAQLLSRESRTEDYRRAFELDPAIDAQRIDARIEQGILTLRLPKSEAVKPRRITVGD